MLDHVTPDELSRLERNELGAEEMLRADAHIAVCPDCRDHLSHAAMGGAGRLKHAFAPAATQHLIYEELEGLVDDTLPFNERAAAQRHLDVCRSCREEFEDLAAFANEKGEQFAVQSPTVGERLRAFFVAGWLPVSAAAAVTVIIIVGSVWYLGRKDEQRLAANPQPTSPSVVLQQQPEPDAPPTGSKPSEAEPEIAIGLSDGTETIGLDSKGALIGYDGFSPAERRTIENVLKSGSLPLSAELRELRSANSATMGEPDAAGDRFDLIGPIGKVVMTQRPTLRWKPLAGSSGYRVDIFDTNFNKVASSDMLSSTAWSPTLADGQTYVWQVTALKDGREIKAPVRPAPEARFRILDNKGREQIIALKQRHPNAHLPLAIAYAQAGLFVEARTELNTFVKENPNSSVAKKLLHSLPRH